MKSLITGIDRAPCSRSPRARRAAPSRIVAATAAGRGRAGAPGDGQVLRSGGRRSATRAWPIRSTITCQGAAAGRQRAAGPATASGSTTFASRSARARAARSRCAATGSRRRRASAGASAARRSPARPASRFSTGGPAVVVDAARRRQRDRGGPALPAAPERRGGRGQRASPTPGARSKASASGCRFGSSAASCATQMLKARRIDAGASRAHADRRAASGRCRTAPRCGWSGARASPPPPTRRSSRAIEQRFRYRVRAAFTRRVHLRARARERAVPADPADERALLGAGRARAGGAGAPAAGSGRAAGAGVRQGRQGRPRCSEIAFPKPLAENAALQRRAAARA